MKILTIPQSGSLAGQTASRNRFGQYLRTRAIPVQPRSPAQLNARAFLAAAAASWRDLTDMQRAGWAALGEQMVRSDSLGQSVTRTGLQAFVGVNTTLDNYAQANVSDPPILSTPPAASGLTPTATASPSVLTLAIASEGTAGFVSIWSSPPVSAGRQFVPVTYKLLGTASGGSPYDIEAAWNARFGPLVVGQKIVLQVRMMADGFESVAAATSIIVS